jgi:urease accessory protein
MGESALQAHSADDGAQTTLLAALQLADSFFPTGMYTQSHGLERFVQEGGVRGGAQIERLLHSYLRHVAATGDALAARWTARAAQHDDAELIAAVDARLEATKLAAEGRVASRRCGGRIILLGCDLFASALLRDYAARVRDGRAPGHQAVALALTAAAAGLDEEAVVAIELHTFMISLLSAAVRLGALDHTTAQRLIVRARPVLSEAAAEGRALDWRDLGGFAPQIELMQFAHAYAETHMFVS